MSKRFVLLFVLTVAFMGVYARGSTAPQGGTTTYLPIVQRGNGYELPEGNLFLYTMGSGGVNNLFLSSPPPPTSTFQLTFDGAVGLDSEILFAPDGEKAVLRSNSSSETLRALEVIGSSGIPRYVVAMGSPLRQEGWSSDGRLLAYSVSASGTPVSSLYVFDVETRTSTLVAEDLAGSVLWDRTEPRLFYVRSTATGTTSSINRVNADGSGKTVMVPSSEAAVVWGVMEDRRLVVRLLSGMDDNLWLLQPDDGTLTRLTNDSSFEVGVTVAPVGDRLFFARGESAGDAEEAFLIDNAGTVVWSYDFECSLAACRPDHVAWAADGSEIAFSWRFSSATGTADYPVYTLVADGSQAIPTELVDNGGGELGYSPDGHYLAYHYHNTIQVLDRTTQTTAEISAGDGEVYFFGWRPLP